MIFLTATSLALCSSSSLSSNSDSSFSISVLLLVLATLGLKSPEEYVESCPEEEQELAGDECSNGVDCDTPRFVIELRLKSINDLL